MKVWHFQKLIFLFLGIFFSSNLARASVTQKSLSIWGHEVNYQLVILQNPELSYDGATFKLNPSNAQKNRIVLNTVFFKKEALEMWDDFKTTSQPSFTTSPDLMGFLSDLMVMNRQMKRLESLTSQQKAVFVSHLKELKKQLQYAAWFEIYQNVSQASKSSSQARMHFVRLFTQIRKQTIEYHEASHLLDEIQRNDSLPGQAYAQDTEVKAFLAELVYGPNPQDSLWQMVAGVLDEIETGRSVDCSIQKLTDVLYGIQTMPWMAKKEMLCSLCFLSKQHAQEIALFLYAAKS